MLKKLRIKFIALNMVTVAAVLCVVFGTVCVINYQMALRDVQTQLTSQAEKAFSDPATFIAGTNYTDSFGTPGRDGFGGGFEGGMGGGMRHEIGGPDNSSSYYPIAVYVVVNGSGLATSSDGTGLSLVTSVSNATVSDDVLNELAAKVVDAEDGFATYRSLGLYSMRKTFDNVTVVALADISTTSSWKTLALVLALVGLATMVVFLIISLFFSRWALKPVQEAWDRERRFVADVSHDLKTPITVILANNSILRESPDATVCEMSQWVESTQTEALEMQSMVNDMLEVTRFDAAEGGKTAVGTRAATAVDIDFSKTVQAQALMFESVAYDKGLTLESDIAPGLAVHGEPQAITRLVSSLIDNACKYTPEGGTITVTLAAASDGRHAIYRVNNTGNVISPEDLPHLFDRFYRTDAARTQGTGTSAPAGHGLGLSIAKSIAESHGGTLVAESDTVHGTTFTARLPVI